MQKCRKRGWNRKRGVEGGEIIEIIPRDPLVQQSENMGKTVIEAFPESKLAGTYTKLAEKIAALCGGEEK